MVSITVYDEAVAYGRMIPVRIGKHVSMVKPQRQREYQDWVRHVAYDAYQEQMGQNAPLLDEALVLSVRVYRQIPQSFSKRKAALAADGLVMPTSKPDLDNYIKLVLDALTGVIWKDDSLVVGYERTGKYYTKDQPHTWIRIWTLGEIIMQRQKQKEDKA